MIVSALAASALAAASWAAGVFLARAGAALSGAAGPMKAAVAKQRMMSGMSALVRRREPCRDAMLEARTCYPRQLHLLFD
jgi:hypothetical protein